MFTRRIYETQSAPSRYLISSLILKLTSSRARLQKKKKNPFTRYKSTSTCLFFLLLPLRRLIEKFGTHSSITIIASASSCRKRSSAAQYRKRAEKAKKKTLADDASAELLRVPRGILAPCAGGGIPQDFRDNEKFGTPRPNFPQDFPGCLKSCRKRERQNLEKFKVPRILNFEAFFIALASSRLLRPLLRPSSPPSCEVLLWLSFTF